MQREFFPPEEAASAVNTKVGLHALKAAHAIVQDLGGGVHRDALGEGPDLRPPPSCTLRMLDNEEMVCKDLTEF